MSQLHRVIMSCPSDFRDVLRDYDRILRVPLGWKVSNLELGSEKPCLCLEAADVSTEGSEMMVHQQTWMLSLFFVSSIFLISLLQLTAVEPCGRQLAVPSAPGVVLYPVGRS